MQQDFHSFLVNLGVSSEQANQLIVDMEATSQDWLLLSIIELLPQHDAAEFDALVRKNTPSSDITHFLRGKIPNLDALLQQRLSLFQQEIISTLKEIEREEQLQQISQRSGEQETSPPKQQSNETQQEVPLSKKELQKQSTQLGKDFTKAVKGGNWNEAVQLMQKRKVITAQQKN